MKIIIYSILFFSILLIGSCKTNEKNYRDAYLKAIDKNIPTDSITEARINAEALPAISNINGNEVRIKSERLFKDYNADNITISKYNIVVASFKQIFNAKSMTDRLNSNGYNAFVLKSMEKQYYVTILSTEDKTVAIKKIEETNNDFPIKLNSPYPYIIQTPNK